MQIINLKQRSREWLDFRKSHVCASDSPIIMGVSPYKTLDKLFEEKTRCYESPTNQWMQRGIDLEPIALSAFEKETGLVLFPCVGLHENGWMAASFDGMTLEKDVIVEIKCPGKKDHSLALQGNIPEKYYPQLQHQIYVSGLDKVYYYSFDGNSGKTIEVNRDDSYIQIMLDKLLNFWQSLETYRNKKERDDEYTIIAV